MCNLYTMTKTVAEVAHLFGAIADPPGNAGDTVYPGYPGIVVAPDAGTLRVRQMIWGFPLTLKGKSGRPLKPKPVNSAWIKYSTGATNRNRNSSGSVVPPTTQATTPEISRPLIL